MSMAKPGEMVMGHRADKKLREQETGVKEKKELKKWQSTDVRSQCRLVLIKCSMKMEIC